MEEVTWEKLGRYRYASQTLTVPYACRADWRSAFQLPNHLWKEGYVEDSMKLHYMMIQMLAAPMPVAVRLGEDDEEGQAEELQGSVTRMVQSRLRRFLAGDRRGLWNDAQADVPASGAESEDRGGAGGIQNSKSQASSSQQLSARWPSHSDATQHGQPHRGACPEADACSTRF